MVATSARGGATRAVGGVGTAGGEVQAVKGARGGEGAVGDGLKVGEGALVGGSGDFFGNFGPL